LKPASSAPNGEPDSVLNDQDKEELFQQFLEWERDRNQNTGTTR
jgi:hypothetical protein